MTIIINCCYLLLLLFSLLLDMKSLRHEDDGYMPSSSCLLFLAFVVPMNDKRQWPFVIIVVFTSSSWFHSSQTWRRWHRVIVFVSFLLLGKRWRQQVVIAFFFSVGVLAKKATTTSRYLLIFLIFMCIFCCEEGDTIWNMSWVHKHVTHPSTMWSIPCSILMNDIFVNNVYACENDHNLVFTHVPSQCPFICAIRYFGGWQVHFISDVGKALVPYAPSSITFKGWLVHMGEWNKGYLFHTSCNNGLHNLVFLWNLFSSFPLCACSGMQWLLLITTPTNQSYAL